MRHFHGSRPARALAASAALLLALLAATPVALRADAVDDDVKAMRDLERAGKEKEDECVAKIDALRASGDPRAFVALKELVTARSDKIACAAIRGLVATWHDPEFFRWLAGRIEDKALYTPEGGRPEVYRCILEAIGDHPPERVKAALKPLGDAVNRFFTTEPDYAERAIRAYGTIPDRFTVQQLLDWLGQANARGAKGEPQAARENRDRAKKAILETLTRLCGRDAGDAEDWKKWWAENGKTFKFPDAPKPAAKGGASADAGADPSGLKEFKDDACGYSVRKPEGAHWSFVKPDYAGPRVGLVCRQPGRESYFVARAYISVHDPAKFEPKDMKAFASWVTDKLFKDELDTVGMPQQPEAKEQRFGGADWTVVTGRGVAAGPKSDWGTMERRYYLTKLGAYILYVDAYVRLGADEEDKEALWSCIEGIVLPAKK